LADLLSGSQGSKEKF